MAEQLTLEQLEQQVTQLSPQDQLTLVAHISEWLRHQFPKIVTLDDKGVTVAAHPVPEGDELLAEIESIAAQWPGEFDSVTEIRQMRQERDEQVGGRIRS